MDRDLSSLIGLAVGVARGRRHRARSRLHERLPGRQPAARPPTAAAASRAAIRRSAILIAAYNEEASIAETLRSIAHQDYPGEFEVFVIDDGSRDRTAAHRRRMRPRLAATAAPAAQPGKSAALNRGLAAARFDLVVTLDADSYLYRDALRNLVERYLSDPPNTRAVAGTMLVRNSRKNWVTKAQEWDYFHGIAAIKRVQSLYPGNAGRAGRVLDLRPRGAARGRRLGGLRRRGHRAHVGDARARAGASAMPRTRAASPTRRTTLQQFVRQRQRWARGMMEAFRQSSATSC